MDKKICDLIGENAVLKNEVPELRKSLFIITEPKTSTTTANSYTKLKRNQRQAQQI